MRVVGLRLGGKWEHLWNKKSPNLLADNTLGLITTKQTKSRSVTVIGKFRRQKKAKKWGGGGITTMGEYVYNVVNVGLWEDQEEMMKWGYVWKPSIMMSANKVDLGFLFVSWIFQFYPPPPLPTVGAETCVVAESGKIADVFVSSSPLCLLAWYGIKRGKSSETI